MEGSRSPSGVAAVAGQGSGQLGNAATRRTRIEDQQEEGDRAMVTAAGQGSAAGTVMKRKRDAVDGDGRGSESSGEQSQLSLTMMPVEPPTLMPLQELVNTCRAMLNNSGNPPTNQAVSFIWGAMDKIGMLDVGLMDEMGFFLHRNVGPQNPPVLTYKAIYKSPDNFMIMVLYMPRGAVMPLHDHLGMTVFTKLLFGSAHIQAYDWVQPHVCAAGPGSALLAEKVRDHHLMARSSRTWVLFPDATGNLNRFVAGQDGPCVFLKVFTPLYSLVEQQHPSFYQYSPYALDLNVVHVEVPEEKKGRMVWVRKIDEPKNFIKIVRLPYRDKIGPDDVALMDEVRFLEETNGGAGHRNDPPIITCKTITVFFLPPGAAMPLHNHPGLTVFSKLLLGSAHVVAYDWVRPSAYAGSGSGSTMTMLAEKALDQEFTAACGAWVLFPDSCGNMHRFVAGEDGPCAFLDVVTPSYSPAKQGPCSFYRDMPYDLHPGMAAHLNTLGEEMNDPEIVAKILRSLPPQFKQIAIAIKTLLDVSMMTVVDLTRWLKESEEAFEKDPASLQHES
ncbi:hypothetical protein PR202_ga12865 [Eleusine coracana subsp. coracana]|uniref:cysteine dioxygenase n=1 Tax=Eleusine coracana subsp. coracana TaxID=191504 RepID=A0AAV5CCT2_ELECO|nr:hypothetical protein PR202_ga12865 [Eleusine coracana subsp. coracana]